MSDDRSTLQILLIRGFVLLLVVAVLGVWALFGMQLEATRDWLTIEIALAVSGGALVLWFVAALVAKFAANPSGLRPPRPQ